MLNTSWYISISWELWGFYIKDWCNLSLTFLDLSQSFLHSYLPKHLSLIQNLFPNHSLVLILHFSQVWSSFHHLIIHFMHFLPNFWGLWKFLGFFKILEVFVKFLGWALLKWVSNHHTLHFMSILTIFSCILDVCFICRFDCVLVGLDWAVPMMVF